MMQMPVKERDRKGKRASGEEKDMQIEKQIIDRFIEVIKPQSHRQADREQDFSCYTTVRFHDG